MTSETAAETMRRRAARLMRERATEATPGPWMQDDDYPGDVTAGERESVVTGAYAADAPHIAGMHPGVALAVADWLDEAADDRVGDSALYVACTYLGVMGTEPS